MQRPIPSRKRAAPGASPMPPQPDLSYSLPEPAPPLNNQVDPQYDWSQVADYTQYPGPDPSYNAAGYNSNGFNGAVGVGNAAPLAPAPSPPNAGQLVRRSTNQQLARQSRAPWEASGVGAQPQLAAWEMDEDEAELEQRALEAKKEAQAKRKQIPPFVQKLSSFLDELRNTDLIRWSDDGLSFVVLDEDEFAKTLIPELFKHNNYASFVRQLNMYGFHKKVGLSDNSMKASEHKRKTPSEYSNKYFRRGRPELLWLIQKPKNVPVGKKGQEGKGGDNDDEGTKKGPNWPQASQIDEVHDSQDLAMISKGELESLHSEIVRLKQQNKVISTWITSVKRQNDQMYQQAATFQAMHDRHESSINAILTFLATFYNRSLEGQGNASIADMFNSALPQQNNQSGNVVDMSDFPGMDFNMTSSNATPGRRRRLLLPAPETKIDNTASPASLRSASASPRPRIRQTPLPRTSATPVTTRSPVKLDVESPKMLGDTSEIMSVINAANATSPAATGNNLDFNSALEHMQTADGNTPLTDQQRNDVLHRLSAEAKATAVNASSAVNTPGAQSAPQTTPTIATPNINSPSFLASPLLNSPQLPFDSEIIDNQRHSLEYMQKLQDEQAAKVQSLAEKLGPLSPNGQIPGLNDDQIVPPADWNMDMWLDNSYFPGDGTTFDDNALNYFDTDAPAGPNPGETSAVDGAEEEQFGADDSKRVQSVSSLANSPATVETVDGDYDADATEHVDGTRKRRRRN